MSISSIFNDAQTLSYELALDLFVKSQLSQLIKLDEKIQAIYFDFVFVPWHITRKTRLYLDLQSFCRFSDTYTYEPSQKISSTGQLVQVKEVMSIFTKQITSKVMHSILLNLKRFPLRRIEVMLKLKVITECRQLHLELGSSLGLV